MKGDFQRCFITRHHHNAGYTRGTFREENTIMVAGVLQSVKTLNAAKGVGYDEMQLEMLEALNQGVLSLTLVCQVIYTRTHITRVITPCQTRVIIPMGLQNKGDRSEGTNYREITHRIHKSFHEESYLMLFWSRQNMSRRFWNTLNRNPKISGKFSGDC